jgi:F0F1-type ATP synthase assembly protein I
MAFVPQGLPDPKDLGHYFALAQVGMEMVFPMCVGIAVDYYLGCKPWATVIGLIFGFAGGMLHLIMLAKQREKNRPKGPPGETK